MSAFTRDWSTAGVRIVDHTKFKSAPAEIRSVMVDLEDRLTDILSGFTAGETIQGIKKGRLITVGTAAPSAPPGTGAAVSFDLYARANGTDTGVELYGLGSGTATELQFSKKGKIPLDVSARLANLGWLIARNYADNANVNILRVNTANAIEIASHIFAPNTNPATALELAPKGYVDGTLAGYTFVPDTSISTGKLKTTTGEVSTSATGAGALLTLPGGEYGFYPQVKDTGGVGGVMDHICGGHGYYDHSASYATVINITNNTGGTGYAQQRYVTASGEDMWIFLLIDKITKEILSAYQAPDHPAYGNGGDFDKMPHPFGSYDTNKHEIIILDKETCSALKAESGQTGKSLLTLVNEDYKPDMSTTETYESLHSGKFLTENKEGKQVQVKQMVEVIPDYIKVRKLDKLTQSDKDTKEVIRQQRAQEAQAKKDTEDLIQAKIREQAITVLKIEGKIK